VACGGGVSTIFGAFSGRLTATRQVAIAREAKGKVTSTRNEIENRSPKSQEKEIKQEKRNM
jgi:hypothetical protein